VAAAGIDVTRLVDVRDLEALSPPRQPGVPELVVLQGQGVGAMTGVDVVRPQRAGLVQVLVGIDDRCRHRLHSAAPA
jgi:hypothetical protein